MTTVDSTQNHSNYCYNILLLIISLKLSSLSHIYNCKTFKLSFYFFCNLWTWCIIMILCLVLSVSQTCTAMASCFKFLFCVYTLPCSIFATSFSLTGPNQWFTLFLSLVYTWGPEGFNLNWRGRLDYAFWRFFIIPY